MEVGLLAFNKSSQQNFNRGWAGPKPAKYQRRNPLLNQHKFEQAAQVFHPFTNFEFKRCQSEWNFMQSRPRPRNQWLAAAVHQAVASPIHDSGISQKGLGHFQIARPRQHHPVCRV